MPNYSFRNKDTGEEFEIYMSINDLDKYKEDNPHLEQFFGRPFVYGDPNRYGKVTKPDNGFREVLRNVKKRHRGSNINTW
jgi:hypothetical protein